MFEKITTFIGEHWIGIIVIMTVILFICWIIGYFCNGFIGTKFELNSVWTGIAAISATGVLGLGKYYTDSKHNSLNGEKPV